MIVQIVLDWLSGGIANLINLIPPLPAELDSALTGLEEGAAFLAVGVARFGVIIPLDTLGTIAAVWVGLLTFWGAVLGVRAVLWIFNR